MKSPGNHSVTKPAARWSVSPDFQIFLGLLGNVALFGVANQMALWSSYEREYRLMCRLIVIALATFLSVYGAVRRGSHAQRIVALFLCVLPVMCLLGACIED